LTSQPGQDDAAELEPVFAPYRLDTLTWFGRGQGSDQRCDCSSTKCRRPLLDRTPTGVLDRGAPLDDAGD
jgi:hypothetical protein